MEGEGKMKKVEEKLQMLLLNNTFLISFIIFVFLKPYFISEFNVTNIISNVFLTFFSFLIVLLYILKKRYSKYQIVLFLFLIVSLIPTVIYGHDIIEWSKLFIKTFSISVYTELLIKYSLNKLFTSLICVLYPLIFLTFVTTLIWPNGIFGNEIILLGYDNSTVVLMITGSLLILISFLYLYKDDSRKILIGFLPFLFSIVTYFIRWSVGAMLGCLFVIFMFFCIYFINKLKLKKLNKLLSFRFFYILSLIFFVLIVCLGIQKYFSFLIVNILHKDITLTNRTYIWLRCFKEISQHPFLGLGIMKYSNRLDLYGIYHAHCNFLNILLESGFIGFFINVYLWLLVSNSLDKTKNCLIKYVIIVSLSSYLLMTSIDVIDNCELLYITLCISYFAPYLCRKKDKNDNNKKVLLLLDSGQPIPAIKGGAIETLIDSIIKENNLNMNFNIDVYSIYDKVIVESDGFTDYHYINNKSLDYLFYRVLNKIREKLFKHNTNIFSKFLLADVEANNSFDDYDFVIVENNPIIVDFIYKKINAKYILHVHNDLEYLKYTEISFSLYDKIICCSNFISNEIKNIYSGKVITVYNGVDSEKLLSYSENDSYFNFNKKPNAITFGYCGRICPEKGIYELIKAFKHICSSNPNVYLMITGSSFFDNSVETAFIKNVKELASECKDNIFFTGYLNHEEIGKFYSSIDIFIQPSIVNEACPLTILESQIKNKIIITTNSGGIPELIKNKNVIIVDRIKLIDNLKEQMLKIINNFSYYKNIKVNKNTIKYYDEKRFSQEFLKNIR